MMNAVHIVPRSTRTIHKLRWPRVGPTNGDGSYVAPASHATFDLPPKAAVVHVAPQDDSFCLWVMLDPNDSKQTRQFEIYGTGHTIPNNAFYIGTVHELQGQLVWHIFER